jgi:cytochrome c553
MNEIARELSDEEIQAAADWFARLKARRWTEVKEVSIVPKTWVPRGRMRLAVPEGGTEPLGDRIITLPQDPDGFLTRNPHTGFIAYVPVGSIERGQALVTTGGSGKTVVCSVCHGRRLEGMRNVPRLAGLHPAYIVRQLYVYQDGRRRGDNATLMQEAVDNLNDDDIINVAAYLASLDPATTSGRPDVQEPVARTTKDGVFTADQAKDGSGLYQQYCSICHGSGLGGKETAPALAGPVFLANWTGLTVNDLFERIRVTMPSDNPGTLSRDQVSQVVAFILNANKSPAGQTELPRESEALKAITIAAN